MRTQEEIRDRVRWLREKAEERDIVGWRQEVHMNYLSLDLMEEFLEPGAREALETYEGEPWKDPVYSEEEVKSDICQYLYFAMKKCLEHRGLSSQRAVVKLSEWAWILERDDLVEYAEDPKNYPQYGGPVLKAFCVAMEMLPLNSEDLRSMMRGEPCSRYYGCGCGEKRGDRDA